MNLYLLTQETVTGYDTYDSAVVCAPHVAAAKRISVGSEDSWPANPDDVKAKYLGKAGPRVEPGVVLASFNAG